MEWILSLMDLFGRLVRRVPVFSWIVFVAPSAGLTTTLLGGRREHRDCRSTAYRHAKSQTLALFSYYLSLLLICQAEQIDYHF